MCFGRSDSEGAGGQVTSRGKTHTSLLKRRRSPAAETGPAEPQDARKLSKLDSTASTLANNLQMSPQKPLSPQEAPRARSLSFKGADNGAENNADNDADNDSLRTERLQSAQTLREGTSSPSKSSLLASSATDDTPLEQRTTFLEAHNAPHELYSSTFDPFVDFRFYRALRFEFKRSTKMSNSELAACFDLISKTSEQDYRSSSRGWDPDYKLEEMSDREMMYFLVRQAEGYIGVDSVSDGHGGAHHAGAILGFMSFKLEPEDEELKLMRPVLYMYEIHLDDRLRGQSLGGRMINWAISQARLVSISKMMLTVFTVNESATRLYEREGFVKDSISPDDRVTRRKVIKADYIIMSKEL
jgi:ribosomal protein S18 acetylase RimI-like enzyme